ncbi:hypothetical protein [Paenibacillus polymyxa]|uniref:hypothetical protein n=1 Tax=Paenibacillus polymyxa TaxID=1406 RepID=UPI0006C43837|nr:hypothetical protein [Paenibacillus polymyxa]KOS03928.1 hypothetical protein AM598_03930 [Paenibacillus polymyxa]
MSNILTDEKIHALIICGALSTTLQDVDGDPSEVLSEAEIVRFEELTDTPELLAMADEDIARVIRPLIRKYADVALS